MEDIVLPIIKYAIWPLTLISVVLIFRKSLINLFNRINKIGYKGALLETNQPSQTQINEEKRPSSTLDQSVRLLSEETLKESEQIVRSQSNLDSIDDKDKKIETLLNYSKIMVVYFQFEQIYSVIFGSQIQILELLNTGVIENKQSLKHFYDIAAKTYPETYQQYDYESYFNFLTAYNLIDCDHNGQVRIKMYGVDFLKYLVQYQKIKNKLY